MPKSKVPKIGIALGGGAARGIIHIGVLEVLEKEGLPLDLVTGTSMGAIIGALYASGHKPQEMKEIVHNLSWKQLMPLLDLAAPRAGFLSSRKIKSYLKELIGDITFAELKKPFACVAADVKTGEEVIFNEGLVIDGVIASMSLPIIFRPVKNKNRFLVDGGIITPIPAQIVRDMGADFVIAVNAIYRHDYIKQNRDSEPSVFDTAFQIVNIMSIHMAQENLLAADIAIEPDLSGIGPGDFLKAPEIVLRGELGATDAIPHLKHLLLQKFSYAPPI
ncbi:patatin family protein [Dehalococcoides mccartyi]|uniref:patatin family protein n=1 Tax=Dehalococcoides mccartyi TaxID=61435 RepID=UPI0006BCCD03|nr:patatin family protein [Dehalococcoides mccartyi]BAS31376.1 patatin [Dehalococcoides mccartyi IBARAKI]